MNQDLVKNVDESQRAWQEKEREMLKAQAAYTKCVEQSYELLKEHNMHKENFMVALIQQMKNLQMQVQAKRPDNVSSHSEPETTELVKTENKTE